MKKRKILIVDDTAENLKAAREAVKGFPDHKFVFLNNATEVLAEIETGGISGVVTDLFFPREKGAEKSYEEYVAAYDSSNHSINPYKARVEHNRLILTASPFAAYGGLIALRCFTYEVPIVIVTSIHRHRDNIDAWIMGRVTKERVDDKEPTRIADGTLILAPLIDRGFLSMNNVLENSHPPYYMGGHSTDKTIKETWVHAIKMCLSQETEDNRPRLRKEQEQRAQEWEERQKREQTERESAIDKEIGDVKVSDSLRQQLMPYLGKTIKIVSPDIAFVVTSRSEYGTSGGCGYWSQLRCLFYGEEELQEWQWRDRYSASNDKPWLSVQGLGEIKTCTNGGSVNVEVELVNRQGNRWTKFSLDISKAKAKFLSDSEQSAFSAKIVEEQANIMKELETLHKKRPALMPDGPGKRSYYTEPRLKQSVVRVEIGLAAFVMEEQIDHHSDDRQMRDSLFVFRNGQEHAQMKYEDHGYDRNGGAFLTIVSLTPDRIVINTNGGKVKLQV